ncbi:carboxypeptidase-like regulatory domain-containing protein, partial [Candidatus Bathyarchaeota archaeon]|nr:carboxypeptidase-like regulatory domain-containing protein [Candidatus Bathyarchaeota archaeon]
GNDPGVLLGSTSTPNIGYVSIDVKTAMQEDINNGRPWSAFMLKMSTNTDSDDRNDYWVFWTYEYGDTTKQPYIGYELEPGSSIYQGDLILQGNNVTIIEGEFNINGSIIVEENATLILRNGVVNFTQTSFRQLNITLRNPVSGRPRLKASNVTLTSKQEFPIYLNQNSTADISDSALRKTTTLQYDDSVMNIHSSSTEYALWSYGSSSLNVSDSTIGSMMIYGSSTLPIINSTVNSLCIAPYSVNCTISRLKPGLFGHWNFISNCSVDILPGGTAPNVTLIESRVNSWRFGLYGTSTITVADSTISDFSVFGSTFLRISDSANTFDLYARQSAVVWLINSTYHSISGIDESASINIAWYLNVHAVDSNGANVPSANVTASIQNATLAESEVTDSDGWARLALVEKTMNDTGEYPAGNYTLKAAYETYSNSTTVNMTENKQITLSIPFVIPEYQSLLVVPLCMLATLIVVIVYKRKRSV